MRLVVMIAKVKPGWDRLPPEHCVDWSSFKVLERVPIDDHAINTAADHVGNLTVACADQWNCSPRSCV